MRVGREWVVIGLLLSGCAVGRVGGSGHAPTLLGGLHAEDEVVVGDLTRILAIAASPDLVYLVGLEGIARWRPIERRWDVPRPAPRHLLVDGVHSAVVDPVDRSLWLASGGRWLRYDPLSDRWSEWSRPPDALDVVAPPPMAELLRRLPGLQIHAAELLTGPGLEQGRFTAVVRAPDGRGWYLGTSHRGAWWYDETMARPEPLSQGIAGSVVGALAQRGDELWVATNRGRDHLARLTAMTMDLARVRHLPETRATSLPYSAVHDLLVDADGLWLATDQGVVFLDHTATRVRQWGRGHGLPDQDVLSVARHRGMLYAGTWAGLVAIDSAGEVLRQDAGYRRPVYALFSQGDSVLWLGTADGVMALPRDDTLLYRPDGLRSLPALERTVIAIGTVGDTLVAVGREQLSWRDPVTLDWIVGARFLGLPGGARIAVVDTTGVWVVGERTLLQLAPSGLSGVSYSLPPTLPGPITDLLLAPDWLWLGTTTGLLRLRWR